MLLKAVDTALRGPGALPVAAWVLALGSWVLAGAVLGCGPRLSASRAAWLVVLASGSLLAVDAPIDLRRQHLVLLLGVALAAAVAHDHGEGLLLWRVQLSVLYGVAAVAKMNESFLGGGVLAVALRDGPLPVLPPAGLLVLAAAATIAVEALLAVTPWVRRLRRFGTVVAVLLHGGALLLLSSDPLVALRLLFFGGTAVLLHAASAGLLSARPARGD